MTRRTQPRNAAFCRFNSVSTFKAPKKRNSSFFQRSKIIITKLVHSFSLLVPSIDSSEQSSESKHEETSAIVCFSAIITNCFIWAVINLFDYLSVFYKLGLAPSVMTSCYGNNSSMMHSFSGTIFKFDAEVWNSWDNICNKTAGYHRHILRLHILVKKAFKKWKCFFIE